MESRYVRKIDDYFVCYLSSQSGCNKGCKFCHLTVTNQTTFKDSDYQDYLNQALQVYRYYRKENKPAKFVHYSFMARGEALSNKYLVNSADEILLSLANLAIKDNLTPKFNISTIIPKTLNKSLSDIFKIITPTIYYSLYSMNPDFRAKWMPAAMEVNQALDLLKEYQYMSKKIIKVHYAFIKNENDSLDQVKEICDTLNKKKIACEFNLVRYNTYSEIQGEESDINIINRNLEYIEKNLYGKVKMIPRVGFDCKASCGCFIENLT